MGAGASSSAAYAVKTQHFIRPLGSSSASDGGAAFMAAASFAVCSFLELEYASQRKAVEALVDHAAEATGIAVHFFSVPQGRGRARVKDETLDLQEDAFMLVASSTLSPANRQSTSTKPLPTMSQVSVLQKAVDFGYASGPGGRLAAAEVRRAGHVDGVLLAEMPAVAASSASGNGAKSSAASGSRSIGEMAVVLWARTLSERLEAIRIDLEAKTAKQAIANIATTLKKVGEGSDGAKGALSAAMEVVPMEALRAGINCDLVQVWVYDQHAGELVLTDGARSLGDDGIRVPVDQSLVGQTLTSSFGQVVCVRDVQADKQYNKAFDEKAGLTTTTSISLTLGGECVPDTSSTEDHDQAKVVQYVNTTRKDGSSRKVDHFDLVQAEALAESSLGPMLQIKQHIMGLVEAQRQRSAVQAVVALVGTLAESITDLSEMLEQEIVGVMDCEDCTCFLVDDALDEMWAPPLHNRPEGIRMKIGDGVAGHVAKLARDSPGEVTVWRENSPQASPYWSGEQTEGFITRNLMVAPVYSSGKDPALLGLIQIVNKRVDKQQAAPGRRKSVARSSFDDEDPRMGTTRTRKSIKVLEEEPLVSFQNRAPLRHFTRHDAHLLESLAENISGHLQRLVGDILFTKAAMDMQDGDALPKMITEFYNTGLTKSHTEAGGALIHALESLEETHSLGEMTMSPTISLALAFDHSGSSGSGADLKSWGVEYWNLTLQDEFGLVRQAIVEFGLPAKLFVSQTRLAAFMNALKSNYRQVPYHNFHHAISTMHYCFKFLYESGIHEDLDHLDLYALLIAALCHDCDHRGCTNQFEVISRSDLAIRYNDNSPLENHHCARAFQIALSAGGAVPPPTPGMGSRRLQPPSTNISPVSSRQMSSAPAPESANTNIFEAMSKEAFSIVRQRMIAGILSTDMRHHGDHVRQLQTLRLHKTGNNSNYVSEKEHHEVESLEAVSSETRQKIVELVLHAADIGSAFMPSHISSRFTMFLMEEFTAQVEQERALGFPVTAFMDGLGDAAVAARSQIGFLDFVVRPMFDPLHRLMGSGLDSAGLHFDENRAKWAKALQDSQEAAEN